MAEQEKSFKALQDDERLKKLQRRLKLNQIKGLNSSLRLLSSPQSSMSVISSIQGDSALSDVSYCSPSHNSSRTGSVITSSINFRKVPSKNLNTQGPVEPGTSSVIEQSLDSQKMNNDRAMMPPPSLAVDVRKKQSLEVAKQNKYHHNSNEALNRATGTSPVPNYDGKASCGPRNSDNSIRRDTPSTEHNATVNGGSPKEGTRSNETSKRNGRVFTNWIVRLNDHGQICIKGKMESREHVRSKAVKKRLNATTVLSVMHHKYHLLGNIHDLKEELPEYIRGKFFNGFPTDWENVRQIWQSYVASGCSQRFRWPRPIADSDDDLLSDITDLPVLNSTKTETILKASSSTVPSNELATKKTTNRPRIETAPESGISEIDVDIGFVRSAAIESSSVRAKVTEALQTSGKNCVDQTSQTLVDLLKSNNQPTSTNILSKEEPVLQKSANMIPKWKIDVIVDNLMNKNCSIEYIQKVIEAINCINELFTMSCTDNNQTKSDKGISVNESNVEKVNVSRDRSNSNFQNTKQTAAAISRCSSLSLASSSESEPELPPKNNTFMCQESARLRNNKSTNCKSPESLKSQISSITQKSVSRNNLSDSTLTKAPTPKHDGNHQKRKDNRAAPCLGTPTMSRIESPGKSSKKSRYNEKLIFDTTDSDTDLAGQNNERTGLVNNSYPGNKAFRRVLGPKRSAVPNEKIVNKSKGISGEVDSDISIIDSYIGPCQKTTAVNIDRTHDSSKHDHHKETPIENFELVNNERNDHVQSGNGLPKGPEKSLDTSDPNVTPQQIGDSCTVRLTKINLDQHNASANNNGTPSRSERIASLRKRRKVDSGRGNDELPESDSENFSLRMSSRGRRILPRLDYWNGERVFLRDQKLVYSPGMPDTTLSSANSNISKKLLISPNKTTLSEPTLPQTTAKNLNRTPKVSKDWSQFENEHRNRNASSNTGILSEITENQRPTSHHSWTRDRRSNRRLHDKSLSNEKQTRRTTQRHGPSSSEEEATPVQVTRRKRRRMY
ncbi:serine-rich adhesin for platelets-like isoform X1 [Neodiprion pinetum]|uniref:serine-rich adhesin for platelets-like isoform X1 n=2 Tax=Neodiprion pinetum TaxID=441929 RepID=UPI001EDF633F|nr:uncharacterized protein LOC124216810 isoform X1 [Neodiprion pinetum]